MRAHEATEQTEASPSKTPAESRHYSHQASKQLSKQLHRTHNEAAHTDASNHEAAERKEASLDKPPAAIPSLRKDPRAPSLAHTKAGQMQALQIPVRSHCEIYTIEQSKPRSSSQRSSRSSPLEHQRSRPNRRFPQPPSRKPSLHIIHRAKQPSKQASKQLSKQLHRTHKATGQTDASLKPPAAIPSLRKDPRAPSLAHTKAGQMQALQIPVRLPKRAFPPPRRRMPTLEAHTSFPLARDTTGQPRPAYKLSKSHLGKSHLGTTSFETRTQDATTEALYGLPLN
ncbi:hypothetical protein OCS_06676 [Ophiocordyceps sinensis CO18]|uniref:Uncharacterized protein n=1 Tax=Ophiocordyceps sinensis (strain Co18 / CGMCC 3.14243) TaxID=911162 RepID=T5A7B7_OPHSC|nr:hypothetical protein OCS_06676 [Ophiocordyceps sinensis CO18]